MNDAVRTTSLKSGIQRILTSIVTNFAAGATSWRVFIVRNAAILRRSGPDPPLGRVRRGGRVPATRWSFHLGRRFRLRRGGPDLHRGACRHQALLIKTAADLVT